MATGAVHALCVSYVYVAEIQKEAIFVCHEDHYIN